MISIECRSSKASVILHVTELGGMPDTLWPSGLEAAVDAEHPIVEDGSTSVSEESCLLRGYSISCVNKLQTQIYEAAVFAQFCKPQFAAHRSLGVLSTRRQCKIWVFINQEPLGVDVRTLQK
jgi:hypothetical protein